MQTILIVQLVLFANLWFIYSLAYWLVDFLFALFLFICSLTGSPIGWIVGGLVEWNVVVIGI